MLCMPSLPVLEGGLVGKGAQNSDEALDQVSYEVTPPDPTAQFGRPAAPSPKPTAPSNDTEGQFGTRSDHEPSAKPIFTARDISRDTFLKRADDAFAAFRSRSRVGELGSQRPLDAAWLSTSAFSESARGVRTGGSAGSGAIGGEPAPTR
jgi:hypothetical protein